MMSFGAIILHLYWNAAMPTQHLKYNFHKQLLSALPIMYMEQEKKLTITCVFIASYEVL